MKLLPLSLDGVFGIASTISIDTRGNFFRIFDAAILQTRFALNQGSVASNPVEMTLRGLHYQEYPNAETKLVQCVTGQVFDVVVDIRKNSPTFGQHLSLLLGPQHLYQGVLIPKGFAHGYLTLEPNSTLLYFMDQPYVPSAAKGIIWNDPTLQIDWPSKPLIISDRDENFEQLIRS
jgi:dTDP-4-dehydrorhamnose 3,5-epimerase